MINGDDDDDGGSGKSQYGGSIGKSPARKKNGSTRGTNNNDVDTLLKCFIIHGVFSGG